MIGNIYETFRNLSCDISNEYEELPEAVLTKDMLREYCLIERIVALEFQDSTIIIQLIDGELSKRNLTWLEEYFYDIKLIKSDINSVYYSIIKKKS